VQRYNLAIIVPLIEEFRVLRELVPSHIHHPEVEDAIYYYPLDLGEPDYQAVVMVLGDMGTTPAGQITEKILNTIQPKLVALVGIAGALDRDVALGDVVVASEINEFLASSKAVPRGEDFIFEYSGRHWDVSFNIRQCVTNFEFADNRAWQSWQQTVSTYRTAINLPTNMPDVMRDVPKLHIGHVASGNTVGAAQGYAVELRGLDRKFLALEMEAAGVAQAARGRQSPIDFLVVRGISDFSDQRKAQLDVAYGGGWRKYAMASAGTFLLELLRSDTFRGFFKDDTGRLARPVRTGQRRADQPVQYSGQIKIAICNRLLADWAQLADYLDVPLPARARFERGREPHGVWEWLADQERLTELAPALAAIGRGDLVEVLQSRPR
jgi:nucleoside phosphorylase